MSTRSRARLGAAATALAVLLGTAACSSSGDGNDDGAKTSGPVELTFWTWAPNMEKVAALWNKDHPDIQVTVNKQDGGDPAVTKLLTAIKAGKGAPDIMQAEYQKIPTLVSNDALADISGEIGDDVRSDFTDASLDAVSLGSDSLFALPQDVAPLALFYRADVFDDLGIDVPTTWDEYADAARQIHRADPDTYLGTFSANDAGWFTGLAQQAGAQWWSVDGDSWAVDIDDEPTQRVADYWGGLVEEGVINNKPMYTPEWNTALNTGKEVGWVSAVWAPGVLAGNAAKTAGKWKMAPLPTWDGEPSTGAWGGSSTGVTTQSEHPQQAAEFVTWLNTDPEAVQALIDQAGIYPASVSAQEGLDTPPAFFDNQSDFYQVATEAADAIQPFTYGPNVNVTYSAYNDEFAKAAESRSRSGFGTALTAMQDTTVADLKNAGFNVAE
jgi:multiple sugar transport system substrate-binding protein